ncbi:MAG: hypothetical protein IKJ27_06785 [Clostridia bacterium]|nr:hypothetical protein [Clostridia bacterium]
MADADILPVETELLVLKKDFEIEEIMLDGNFPTALLVCELVPGALDGRRRMYIPSTAADCCEDIAAVEAFDKTFGPKEKKRMPSQEEFYIYSHSNLVR